MARLEDYLDQATLDKLRGIQSSAPSMEQSPAMPEASPSPMAGPLSVPPAPTQGTGPVVSPVDYSNLLSPKAGPAPASAQDDDNEAGDDAKNQVLKDVFSGPKPSSTESPSAAPSQPEGFTNNTVDTLKTAQAEANRRKDNLDLVNSAALTMSGALGAKGHTAAPDISGIVKMNDEKKKDADELVSQSQALGEKEKDDPNSAASVNMRQLANELSQKAGLNITFNDKLSFADIEKKFPSLTKMYDAKMSTDARRDMMKDRAADRELVRGQKSDDKQDKVLQSTQQLLESARGNPAAAQAEKDLYAAQKADSLFNRYKDPNKMNSAEVQLYATEIAKMASGGVPSIHELQGLNPATIPSELSKLAQKVTNNPTSANAGEFLKRYKAYSDSLAKDARNVIHDKYSRVIESRKKQLGDDNYKSLQDHYINRFDNTNDPTPIQQAPSPNEERRVTKDGRTAIFDKNTKQFIRYE